MNTNNMNRREFMRLTGVAGLASVLSVPLRLTAEQTMTTRPIPASGEAMPVIGLGSSSTFRQLPEGGAAVPKAIIREMLDAGGRLIDAAGNSLYNVSGLLREMGEQEKIFISAKYFPKSHEDGIRQIRGLEQRWGRSPVDLINVHMMMDLENQWPVLLERKAAGHTRYIGVTVSHHSYYEYLESFMRNEKPDFIQLNYSLMERGAEQRLLPLAQERGIAVVVNRPFMNGNYFGYVRDKKLPEWTKEFDCETWAHFSLKFILAHPAVTSVLTETSKPKHAKDNMRAGLGRLPNEEHKRRMIDFIKGIT